MGLHWHLANPARNLAGLGQISEKQPDFGFAEPAAKIRCNPSQILSIDVYTTFGYITAYLLWY